MSKKKNKHKLTPETYKKILTINQGLAQFQKKSKSGKSLFRTQTKIVKGEEMSEPQRLQIKNFDSSKSYILGFGEPILVNHVVNLIEIYKKQGEIGMALYKDYFENEKLKYDK